MNEPSTGPPAEPGPFELRPPPAGEGLVGVRRLAAALGVSAQSIDNWRKAGMPCAGTDALGNRLYPLEECRAWRLANRPEGGRIGGKRPGSGRKPRSAVAGAGGGAGGGGGQQNGTPPLDREAIDDETRRRNLARNARLFSGQGTTDDFQSAIEPVELGGLSLEKLRRLNEVQDAIKKRLDIDVRREKLIDRLEVKAEWSRHMTTVAGRIRGIPAALTPIVMAAAGVGPELAMKIRSAVEAFTLRLLEEVAEDPAGRKTAAG